eukprot:TRINITY_DN14661_c0_g1_i1.p1 TRINITY_DN14661_c0_g1~~TRINITY_DN14661_c0_g1_i1.p1  ORF type:complete len:162 (-),score=25.46 TRINITY_DN14661_c0_g1_i1:50-535(-)
MAVNPGHPHYTHRGPPALGPFNKTKTHDDPERWVCIYPAYMNSKKSLKDGRRIPKDKAVDTPTYQEIKMVLDDAKVDYILERKFYSRERSKELPYVGRFRVHLKDKEGEFIREDFQSRDSILLYVAEKIPQLKSRTNPKGPAENAPQAQTGAVPKKKKGKK